MTQNSPKNSSTLRKTFAILLIAVLLIGLEIWAQFPNNVTPLERVELSLNDTFMRLRPARTPNPDIVIVDVDDASLSWVGEQWPWSRARLAEIVHWLDDAGAKIIAFDIFLIDPATDPAEDEALVQTFEQANTVITVGQIISSPYSVTLAPPTEIYQPVIDAYGITDVIRGDDAVVRSVDAYEEIGEQVIYHWAFEIAAAYLDATPPSQPTQASLLFNEQNVPLNQRGQLLVNFIGPPQTTYPTYSAAFVPLGDYDPALFKDKIVFIGASSKTLQDLYPTPYSATVLTPGVEIVANTVDTLLSGDYLRLVPPWVTTLLILTFALAARLLAGYQRPTLSISLMSAATLGYLLIRQGIFMQTGWQLAIVTPSLMLLLGVVLPTLDQAVQQEIEKRRIRHLFGRFISPQMVSQLLETQDLDSLNKRTELTILFSDIRGFTTLSENMSPEDLVNLLNPYLEAMTQIIHQHGGTVDKYEGDAIIAFFGEPLPLSDHAQRAARAALDMRTALTRLNATWQAEGLYASSLEMGIGIHTGEVFVGLIGSEERINYTVIGDAANLASRLQDQTKELGYPILVSGATYQSIQQQFQLEYVDTRQMKGRKEPVEIYRLIS